MAAFGDTSSFSSFNAPGALAMTSKVELSISCKNLCDTDVFSLSDPIVVVYQTEPMSRNAWVEIGRTEIVWNNLNPVFSKKFEMEYHFEEVQKLKFDVYDVDSKSPDLSKHDYLGGVEVNLGEVVSSGTFQKHLRGGPKKNKGAIILKAEEVITCKSEITMEFIGKKLDRKDVFGSSDPFLEFSRSNEDGSRTLAYRNRPIKNCLNPKWPKIVIKSSTLCNGDLDRSILISCFDWNKNGRHNLIGECSVTLRQLQEWPNGNHMYPLIHPEKQKKKRSYRDSGILQLVFCKVEEIPSFLDYIQGGCELNCSISIDFTASNGDPNKPGTLHFMTAYQASQYSIALQAVGEIIQDYDSDNLFPALGFGARIPPNMSVSHCFPLNFNNANPFCHGIEGVVQAYQQCLRSVQLYGPTNFAPTINHVASLARQHSQGDQYFILLILTDGIITDMPQTREAIVQAASLPLSIIIVGIGDADFENMDELDGDEVRLSSNGRYAERDIVQFVPFKNFIGHLNQGNVNIAKRMLTQAVLAEIPDQLVSFMRSKNIKPGCRDGRINRNRRDTISSITSSMTLTSVSSSHPPSMPSNPLPPPAYDPLKNITNDAPPPYKP